MCIRDSSCRSSRSPLSRRRRRCRRRPPCWGSSAARVVGIHVAADSRVGGCLLADEATPGPFGVFLRQILERLAVQFQVLELRWLALLALLVHRFIPPLRRNRRWC